MNPYQIRLECLKLAHEYACGNQAMLMSIANELYDFVENERPVKIQPSIAFSMDPIQFIERSHIQHPTKGAIPFALFDFQKEMIQYYQNNKVVLVNTTRQMGTSTTTALYVLWYVLSNPNKEALLLGPRVGAAIEMLQRIKYAYENMDESVRPVVKSYSEGKIEFDNGSRITTKALDENSARGKNYGLIWVDSFAYANPQRSEDFVNSAAPCFGTCDHVIMTSNPYKKNGAFYRLFTTENDYTKVTITWDRHPDRDEHWLKAQKEIMSDEHFRREFMNEFVD